MDDEPQGQGEIITFHNTELYARKCHARNQKHGLTNVVGMLLIDLPSKKTLMRLIDIFEMNI